MTAKARDGDGGAHEVDAAVLFAGGGEMRARCRAHDWAATPLGPVERWPQALRTAAGLVLGSAFPSIVLWGPDLVQLYNDASVPLLGVKHPWGLGRPTVECWPEARHITEPVYTRVRRGESVALRDQRLQLRRRGADAPPEDVYVTVSFVPIPDETGGVGGIHVTIVDTTAQAEARAHESERARLLAAEGEARAEAEAVRERFTTILESISDAFYAVDAEFRFTYVNGKAEELWGRRREELIGRHYWTEFPGAVGSESYRMHQTVMAERQPAHYETVSPLLNRWIDVSIYPEATGGLSCFFRIIEERKQVEAAREAERALLQTVLDQLPVGVIIVEAPSGRVLALNGAVSRIWGGPRPRTEAIERYSLEWVGYHIDGRRVRSQEWPIAQAVLTGEPVVDWVGEIERADGSRALIEASAAPVRDAAGKIVAGVAVATDISARVRAERERERLLRALEVERARLADVFRRAPSFIVAFRGSEQRYEFVNEAYYQLVGHRDILGKPLLEAIPEIRGQGFEDLLERVRQSGEPWVGREAPVELQRTPGAPLETRYLDMVFQPLTEADGTRSGVVVHGSDITAQVLARRDVERLLAESERARAEAEAARAEAEVANRTKSEFLAVMSHELRTPLNAIGGYAELLEMGIRGPITDAQREDLARIQQSQRHLLGLINEVLNYTRIETGTVRYEVSDVDVVQALTSAEALVAPQIRAKGLAYELGGCDSGLAVRADPEKLRQVVLNLLTNAVKFTEPGGRITIGCARRGDVVAISVADTGIGVPPEKLASIFEPFVQVDQRLTRPHEGVGLGLAISRDLARGMGGDLTAASTPGAGSTFTLTLPRA